MDELLERKPRLFRHSSCTCFVTALAILAFSASAALQAEQPPRHDEDPLDPDIIAQTDLEQLFRIPVAPVATVAGVPRPLLETPSAVTVLTREDIGRSGHRSLAEAMRLVPGMYVGRSASHTWRVGARGFAGGLAPRNLVLIDGRTVYDPLHGGVFWDVQDVVFEDLDRIEVIRGPGATLWGANAMNGVINVISKSAHDTQGLVLLGGGGTYERAFTTVRYGDRIDEDTAFRVYGKYFNRERFRAGTGLAHDDWSMLRGGFRLDHRATDQTTFTVMGEGYGSLTRGETVAGAGRDSHVSGAHFLTRLAHDSSDGSGWTLQTYYDRTNRELASIDVYRDTFDIDFRHHFQWGDGPGGGIGGPHELIWGLGYRFTTDRTTPGTAFVDPRSRDLHLASLFVQNTFTILAERLFFMLGTKLHWHTYTDWEIQPGGRLWWTPDDKQTIWGAISRPVRIPSRLEQEGGIGTTIGGVFTPIILPGRTLDVEELLAYELGYRVQPVEDLMLEATLFYHDYEELIGVQPQVFALQPAPWTAGSGESYGVTVGADWRVIDNWRVGGGYSYHRAHVHGPILPFDESDTPEHQAFLRSHLDITPEWFLDTIVYYYDHLPARVGRASVPSYIRLDVGVTYKPSNNFEISLWGQNLTNRSTAEASPDREFPRGFYLMGTIRF